MRLLLLVIAITTGVSSSARAGWEWTNWGMTQHAVRKGAPGDLDRLDEPVAGARLTMLLSVEVAASGIDFQARLGFSEFGELAMVELRPADEAADCVAASEALARQHGAPVSRRLSPSQRVLWADVERDTLVEFTSGGDGGCMIRLTPLPRRNPYLGG